MTGRFPRRGSDLAAQLGSDVPYCVLGGTMLAEGRGEILTPWPQLSSCGFVLCKPAFSCPTGALFAALDAAQRTAAARADAVRRPDFAALRGALERGDLTALGQGLCNVFGPVLAQRHPEVLALQDALLASGALVRSSRAPALLSLAVPDGRRGRVMLRTGYA